MTDVATTQRPPTRERIWFYSNYHCNLACSYCLTESGPGVARRALSEDQMRRITEEAAELGFGEVGITGGEPFLLPFLPELLRDLATRLPVVVLTNGTLFGGPRLERLRPLAGLPVRVQVSLDSADPEVNDAARGPENFAKVIEAIPRLVELGVRVRVATTGAGVDPGDLERLCALHRSLGVDDADHVVRPVVSRGRGLGMDGAVAAGVDELQPELTITADGAYWSPFGPTVVDGVLDTDLLLTRTVRPLRVAADALDRVASGRPAGDDARTGIR